MTQQIAQELIPVLKQLQNEGFKVYSYKTLSNPEKEVDSLYWFEKGRILNIYPSVWKSEHNKNCYFIGVDYIPSAQNGSGCRLNNDDNNNWGFPASHLLEFRNIGTWVRDVKNYNSMEHFLKKETILKFYELEVI